MMVEIPPIITLYMSRVISTSGFMETIPPTTSPANESFAKSKNNPASFSRLTLLPVVHSNFPFKLRFIANIRKSNNKQ